jgi:restriction system protein
MGKTVYCASCGEVLDKDDGSPCPKCGSISVAFNLSLDLLQNVVALESGLADLLLESVVVCAEETAEGRLIEAVAIPWFKIIERFKAHPDEIFQIPPGLWEEIIAGAYKEAGFDSVTLTPRSGDLGRDVIAEKRGLGTIRVIDQVKAYSPGHLVTANDVRALMGVLPNDGASKGFVTTTSDFAPKLRKDPLLMPFMPSRLQLIDGKMLRARLIEIAKKRGR